MRRTARQAVFEVLDRFRADIRRRVRIRRVCSRAHAPLPLVLAKQGQMAARDATAQRAEIAVSIDTTVFVRVVVVMRMTVYRVGVLMLLRVLRVLVMEVLL